MLDTSTASAMFTRKGLLLGSRYNADTAKLCRMFLDGNRLFRQVFERYVPPVFIVLGYERSPITRLHGSSSSSNTGLPPPPPPPPPVRSDTVLDENRRFVSDLLTCAGCPPTELRHTFLRLEYTAGSLQADLYRLNSGQTVSDERVNFPVPALAVGCLARLEFGDARARRRALDVLVSTRLANRDVYAVNCSANLSVSTLVTYMEPLFFHAWNLQESNTRLKLPPLPTPIEEDSCYGMEPFELTFRVETGIGGGGPVCSSNDTERELVTVVGKRKRKTQAVDASSSCASSGPTQPKTYRASRTLLSERPATVAPTNTTTVGLRPHDVFNFYKSPFFVDTTIDDHVQRVFDTLPVVCLRFDRNFYTSMTSVPSLSAGVYTMTVYYCWTPDVEKRLKTLVDTEADPYHLIAVNVVRDCHEAGERLIADSKLCFWSNAHTYVRLSLGTDYDNDDTRRAFFRPLLKNHQRRRQQSAAAAADLMFELERLAGSDTGDMYPQAITIDCNRLVKFLGPKHVFTQTYNDLLNDPSFLDNTPSPTCRQVDDPRRRRLVTIHRKYQRLLDDFVRFRLAARANDMAREMFVGVSDAFGTQTEKASAWLSDSTRYRLGNETRALSVTNQLVMNTHFLYCLTQRSVYYAPAAHPSDNFFTANRNGGGRQTSSMPPALSQAACQLYTTVEDKTMYELDMVSAYPSMFVSYNVSPENTLLVRTVDWVRIKDSVVDTLQMVLVNNKAGAGNNGDGSTRATGTGQSPDSPLRNQATALIDDWFFVKQHHYDDLVIVSLRPEIYRGCLAHTMERLVAKRQSRGFEHFFKFIANRLYGLTQSVGSDLYSIGCASAVVSLCRTHVTGLVRSLEDGGRATVIRTQVDGCIVKLMQSVDDSWLQEAVTGALLPRQLRLRIRPVDTCVLLCSGGGGDDDEPATGTGVKSQRYVLRYTDTGELTTRGQQTLDNAPRTSQDAVSSAVSLYLVNEYPVVYSNDPCSTHQTIDTMLTRIITSLAESKRDNYDDDECHYISLNLLDSTTPFQHEKIAREIASMDLLDDVRIGKPVAVWPTLYVDGDDIQTMFSTKFPTTTSECQSRVDVLFVLRPVINGWIKDVCRTFCHDFNPNTYSESFKSIFYSHRCRYLRHLLRQ